MTVATPVRVRADAVRNAEKVLAAAREVFAERGLGAGIDEVAARAGVGKATVYRCYATKADLVTAVVMARVEWFTALAREAAASADPWSAFVDLLRISSVSAASNALVAVGLGGESEAPPLRARRAECLDVLQQLLDAAAVQGRARADVTSREVTVLLCGAFRTLADEGIRDPAQWARYADLVARIAHV